MSSFLCALVPPGEFIEILGVRVLVQGDRRYVARCSEPTPLLLCSLPLNVMAGYFCANICQLRRVSWLMNGKRALECRALGDREIIG